MGALLLIFGFGVVAIVLWLACAALDEEAGQGHSSAFGIWCGGLAVLPTVFAVVAIFFWIVMGLTTRSTVNDMVAFYESNQHNFTYAVESTEDVNIVSSNSGLIDVAYWEQGKLTGVRIQEQRNHANRYNRTLQNYRDKNTHWFLGVFYHDPPDHLKPIILLEVAEPSSP